MVYGMAYILVIIGGLIIGSFINVIIHRLPRGESVVLPVSHCPHCKHALRIYHLIPVFSYLGLKGRCQYCRNPISLRYPLVEILSMSLFILVLMKWGFSLAAAGGWILTIVLMNSAFIDLEHGIIPDQITYPAMIAGLLIGYFTVGIKSSLLGLIVFAGILLLLAVVSDGGMGGGDVKLAAIIGLFCGLEGALLAFIISAITGGMWALYLLLVKQAGRKAMVKFGPFLAWGAFISYNYADEIIFYYLQLFLM